MVLWRGAAASASTRHEYSRWKVLAASSSTSSRVWRTFHSGLPRRQQYPQALGSPEGTTTSGVAIKTFLVELEKDPSLFGKLWETASKDVRQEMMKPVMATLSNTVVGRHEFAKADQNGDGVLTVGEFEHWLTGTLKRTSSSKIAAIKPTAAAATATAGSVATTVATRDQLRKVAVLSAIPFIGFGFLDNALMICSGSQIEVAFSSFGISAMAAAALGNTLSDVAGIQAGGWIESMAAKMGLPDPHLTLEQIKSPMVRRVTVISSAVGITIGCLLGMIPLLFINEEDKSLRRIFDDIDLGKTGTITFEELKSAIGEVGLKVDQEELKKSFSLVATTEMKEEMEGINFQDFKKLVLQYEQHLKERAAK